MTKIPDLKYEPDWRRLKFVIDQSGLTEKEFAEILHLPDPEIITHIRYAQHGISEEFAERINSRYPQYSVEWLQGQPEAKAPEPGELFPAVYIMDRIKHMAYRQAEHEFELQADYVAKQIVKTVPLKGEERAEMLDHLAEQVVEMCALYEVVKECSAPENFEALKRLSDRSDELYEAAEQLGAVLF